MAFPIAGNSESSPQIAQSGPLALGHWDFEAAKMLLISNILP
jgi:hypothetical protein